MEKEPQPEQPTVKPKFSKLAITAAVAGMLLLPLQLLLYFLGVTESLSFSQVFIQLMLFSLIPLIFGGWSIVCIIKSNGKLKGLIFSAIGIGYGLYRLLSLLYDFIQWGSM